MSISIDSTNSLSELNIIEPRSSGVNIRSPILGLSQPEILTSTRLHPINEIAHLEDAGDMTVIQD